MQPLPDTSLPEQSAPENEARGQTAYDASNRQQVETMARRARDARLKADQAFVRMMETADFRAFVWSLFERAHLHELSFDRDPHVAAFREGERNFGLTLLDQVNRLAPRHYLTMAEEAALRKEQLNDE